MLVAHSICFNRRRLLLLCAFAWLAASQLVLASDTPGFRSIVTAPDALANGSPFLLTVFPAVKVSAAKGTWLGKDLLFFRGKSQQGIEIWYALTGIDVETRPGTYPLTVDATTLEGKSLHANSRLLWAPRSTAPGR